MTKNYFEEIMQELGCHTKGGLAFGDKNGFPYSVELVKKGKSPVLEVRFVLNASAKACAKLLKQTPGLYMRWHAEGFILVAVLEMPSEFYVKSTLHGVFAAVKNAAAQTEVSAPENCPLCGNPVCDVYAWVRDAYQPAHEACINTRLALPQDDVKSKISAKGNPFTGMIGALLGAVVGGLPAWGQIMMNGSPSPILYAFIPIFSALLYRLCRGKAHNNYAGLCVLVSSVLGALGLEQIGYWMLVNEQYNGVQQFSLLQTIPIYFTTHEFFPVLAQMVFCLVCLAVGMLPAARFLRGYASANGAREVMQRGMKYVQETMRPIHANEEPQSNKEADKDMSASVQGGDAKGAKAP